MANNPYQPPADGGRQRNRRGLRWAVWSGVTCLAVAAICAVLIIYRLVSAFDAIANSSTAPTPRELSSAIPPTIYWYGMILFGLAGIVLLILGWIIRRPIND